MLLMALGACSGNVLDTFNPFKTEEDESQRGTIGFVRGFLGGIVADEPRAVLIGRDILSSGGTAADAAVAVSFALSVSLPSSASLGGGGLCVVHDNATNVTETLDFQARSPNRVPPSAAVPVAVPSMVRGLAALHAKYGRLKWAQVVAPAENLARFGNQVSRALAEDLKWLAPAGRADPEIRKVFGRRKDGRLLREGDFFVQTDLSAVLARLRSRGAGDFYAGLLARQIVAAVAAGGGSLTADDLRSYSPRWADTLTVPYAKNTTLHFPAAAGPAGVLAAQMTGMLAENGDWEDASPAERAHLLAEISGRAFGARRQWLRDDGGIAVAAHGLVAEDTIEALIAGFDRNRRALTGGAAGGSAAPPRNPTGTTFVVVDRRGSAAACGLTLNNLFGVGRVAPGTGIVLAALPGPFGRGPDALAAMLLTEDTQNTFYFGAAASGGPAAPSAMAGVAAGILMGKSEETPRMAITAKRVHSDGDGPTYYEEGLAGGVAQRLAGWGHRLQRTPAIGLVNAILCPIGIPSKQDMSCSLQADPRGFGLASGTE